MATRTQVREAIISLLYSQDIDKTTTEQFDRWKNELFENRRIRNKQKDFAEKTVQGLFENLQKVDELISKHLSENWELENLGKIEKAILRLGIYEIVFENLQKGIAISEALNIMKKYGNESSTKLINAVLDTVGSSSTSDKDKE
jgi:N utilization substance protein B